MGKLTKFEFLACFLASVGAFALWMAISRVVFRVASHVEIRWVESSTGDVADKIISRQ
jgi:hypothetical protein